MISTIKKILTYLYLRYYGVETRYGYVELVGLPIIKKHRNSHIIIKKGVVIISKSAGNVAGINHPTIIATLSDNAKISIGENTGISGASIVSVKSIKIGNYVGIGANSNIFDTDFHTIHPFS